MSLSSETGSDHDTAVSLTNQPTSDPRGHIGGHIPRPRPGRLALQEACRSLLDAALAARIASEVGNEPLARLWARRTAHAAARLDDLLTARIVPPVDATEPAGVGGVPGSAPVRSTVVADGSQGACGPQRPEPRTPSITVGAR